MDAKEYNNLTFKYDSRMPKAILAVFLILIVLQLAVVFAGLTNMVFLPLPLVIISGIMTLLSFKSKGSKIVLTKEGFKIVTVFGSSFYEWNQMGEIKSAYLDPLHPFGNRFIYFTTKDGKRKDFAPPPMKGLTTSDLEKIMENWRKRFS